MFLVLVYLKYTILCLGPRFGLIEPSSKPQIDIFQFYKDKRLTKYFTGIKNILKILYG